MNKPIVIESLKQLPARVVRGLNSGKDEISYACHGSVYEVHVHRSPKEIAVNVSMVLPGFAEAGFFIVSSNEI